MSEDAQIRRERLKSLGYGPSDLQAKLGKSTGYWSALMSSAKSFGEKAARSIEEKLGLPRGWLDQAGDANAIEGEARVAGSLPQGERGVTLEQALEALGIALAVDMPDEVREDVADALAKLARRKGQFRDQQQVLQLLTEPVAAAPTKRHGT